MPSITVGDTALFYDHAFDPTYGYSLADLLAVQAPEEPADFAAFWSARHARARLHPPRPILTDTGRRSGGWRVMDFAYQSTDNLTLRGWALVPEGGKPTRGFIVGHGYGGRDGPDFGLPFHDAVILFPCARGLGRSALPGIPSDPRQHVVQGIEDRERYVLAGCVDDLWLAISALLELFPSVTGRVGLLGTSFSGGITVLAAPWDERIQRVHVEVPTFGHQALRLVLPTTGSGAGLQAHARQHPETVACTLPYFDAAFAARHMRVPVHCACARFDPVVAPPGQFAIHNALRPDLRQLTVLSAGHHAFPGEAAQAAALARKVHAFFADV